MDRKIRLLVTLVTVATFVVVPEPSSAQTEPVEFTGVFVAFDEDDGFSLEHIRREGSFRSEIWDFEIRRDTQQLRCSVQPAPGHGLSWRQRGNSTATRGFYNGTDPSRELRGQGNLFMGDEPPESVDCELDYENGGTYHRVGTAEEAAVAYRVRATREGTGELVFEHSRCARMTAQRVSSPPEFTTAVVTGVVVGAPCGVAIGRDPADDENEHG